MIALIYLYFQSNNRETDISMVRFVYSWQAYLKNDFIGPIEPFDVHLVSGVPPERNEYLALLRPFDSYTWIFTIVSFMGVCISLIFIEKLQATWSKEYPKDCTFQSKKVKINLKLFRANERCFFSVISFSIGAIIDEALGAHYDKNFALQKSNSKARTWIVFKWMIVGFFLTVSYKSVLRAMMMKISYENTIDDIDEK